MQAMAFFKYGLPVELKLIELEKPVPKNGEVLVKVHAAALNSADWDMLKGTAFGRLSGLFKPRYTILGSDVSGVVESVGSNVSLFKPDDEVFGDMTEYGFGTFAEYICVPEHALHKKLSTMTFEQAAALASAGALAHQAMTKKSHILPGQSVLINGAGGGMGTFALQIAKASGAEVACVDRTEKLDKILELGADEVIDFNNEDYTKRDDTYDLIVDISSNHKIFTYSRLLKPGGVYYMIGGTVKAILWAAVFGPLVSRWTGKSIGILVGKFNQKEDIDALKEMFEEDTVVPIIDRVYPLKALGEAFWYYHSGKFVGKIVIKVI